MESFGSLQVGFPVALFLIYVIIAVLFKSYVQPFIVMLAIPFSLVGAVLGHYFMGYPVTFLSAIGAVALAGIVVNDSLILVDFINRARERGATAFEAVVAGGKSRLRAIILTSLTTILGLAPMMLERSFQAQFLIPMAISIVFGLAFATVLTLYVLPATYCIIEDFLRLIQGRRSIGEGEAT
jgi:multidrug efflux pump subunit AcrB